MIIGTGGFAQWGANFTVTMTLPIMLAGIGLGGAYAFYAICSILSISLTLKSVKETKGIELEEMPS